MKIQSAFVVCAALALACVGCLPVAHVELADGTLVSFIQPTKGATMLPNEKDAEGRTVRVAQLTCKTTREVGLAGEVVVRTSEYPDDKGDLHKTFIRTFRLTNVSDKPIALKRFLAYGHLPATRKEQPELLDALAPKWEDPAVCDPERGFSGIVIDNTRYNVVRAEEPGFNYRLILMAQPWHLEGDILVQPLPTMRTDPDQGVDISFESVFAAPGAEAFLRPLGGGNPFASQPIKPASGWVDLYFSEGVPTMMPLELCFKAAPNTPETGWLISPRKIEKRTPIYAIEGVKDLNCTLAPGESLTFTLFISSVETPTRPVKKD